MAFVLNAFRNDKAAWAPPRTERGGLWLWAGYVVVGPDGRGTPVGSLKVVVIVCKDRGGCRYGPVQEAVNAASENLPPGKKFVIGIKAGVYKEVVRVPIEKMNLVFLSDERGKTVISSSLTAGPGISIMEAIINPQGWLPWTGNFALKTLYYGEFVNNGPGSDTSQRVSWSSQIPVEHVNAYSIGKGHRR